MFLGLNENRKRILIVIFAFASISFTPFIHHPTVVLPGEICDNGIDDDLDGLIDLNDPDCVCEVIEPLSLVPNPSFEDTDCCPTSQSQLDCATGWIQASLPTTDFINTCGWLGWDDDFSQFPPPQPFPDGQGIVGFRDGVNTPAGNVNPEPIISPNYKEYAGACLTGPMQADSAYRFEFDLGFVTPRISPPIEVTFYGTTECANLPFGSFDIDSLPGCPTNVSGWVKLGSVYVVSPFGNEWINTAIDVIPEEDIYAIAIGPDCDNNLLDNSLYYFLDNLILDKAESFQLDFETISSPCDEDFAIQVEDYPDVTYQWYKDGIALVGETSAEISQMYGEGDYQVRIDDGTSCSLSGIFQFTIPVIVTAESQTICEGEVFSFGNQDLGQAGMYTDTLSAANNCDSVVVLSLEIEGLEIDTMDARIFEGETIEIGNSSYDRPGEYTVRITSENGCDVFTVLRLEYFKVFIPNVFSPNDDGINDTFTALGEQGLIQDVELSIFNRWGGLLYQGPKWDGRRNNEIVDEGVYVYMAKVTMNNNTSHMFSGSVTVVR